MGDKNFLTNAQEELAHDEFDLKKIAYENLHLCAKANEILKAEPDNPGKSEVSEFIKCFYATNLIVLSEPVNCSDFLSDEEKAELEKILSAPRPELE